MSLLSCAPDRSWTDTAIAGHRILSPACLPIPPPGRWCKNYFKNYALQTHKAIAGYPDSNRDVSTNSTIRATKKNPSTTRRKDSWSGRPGSNRPPRPWQGRALPNELLPQIKELLNLPYRHYLFPAAGRKNKAYAFFKKILDLLFIFWSVQAALLNRDINLFIPLGVQHITAAQCESYKTSYLQVEKKSWRGNPVVGKITILYFFKFFVFYRNIPFR